jgi:CheY-like chemotaxis protein
MFTVCLPIVAAEPATEAQATVRPAPTLRNLTVLVVDDDPEALEFARSTLEHYGASVMIASSVDEARERYTSRAPDVILSDLRMPEEDGLELIREVRALDERNGRRTPAAALTALARSDDRTRALSAGFQLHVVKPIDPFDLAVAVERLARSVPEDDRQSPLPG